MIEGLLFALVKAAVFLVAGLLIFGLVGKMK